MSDLQEEHSEAEEVPSKSKKEKKDKKKSKAKTKEETPEPSDTEVQEPTEQHSEDDSKPEEKPKTKKKSKAKTKEETPEPSEVEDQSDQEVSDQSNDELEEPPQRVRRSVVTDDKNLQDHFRDRYSGTSSRVKGNSRRKSKPVKLKSRIPKCIFTMTRGMREGQPCGKPAKDGYFCKPHSQSNQALNLFEGDEEDDEGPTSVSTASAPFPTRSVNPRRAAKKVREVPQARPEQMMQNWGDNYDYDDDEPVTMSLSEILAQLAASKQRNQARGGPKPRQLVQTQRVAPVKRSTSSLAKERKTQVVFEEPSEDDEPEPIKPVKKPVTKSKPKEPTTVKPVIVEEAKVEPPVAEPVYSTREQGGPIR